MIKRVYALFVFTLLMLIASNIFAGNVSSLIHDDGTKVGVCTNEPNSLLHIRKGYNSGSVDPITLLALENNSHAALTISTPSDKNGFILFADNDSYNSGYIKYSHPNNSMYFRTNNKNQVIIDSNGNVGIQTNEPNSLLHIRKGHNSGSVDPITLLTLENNNHAALTLSTPSDKNGFVLFADNDSYNSGYIKYSHSNNSMYFRTNNKNQVIIDSKGNIGIGTESLVNGYKITVNGGIYAESIRVRNDIAVNNLIVKPKTWSDFVFEKEYKLTPLSKLEKTIRKNKHLPGIPSEEEVKNKGISVGEMQAKLLQKIEELTLYVIEIKKENQNQSQKIEAQTKRINELAAKLSAQEFVTLKNKHLPGIPSEKEVMKNGISVGEMQANLLQKIEELTLYVIEQDKAIKALQDLVGSSIEPLAFNQGDR